MQETTAALIKFTVVGNEYNRVDTEVHTAPIISLLLGVTRQLELKSGLYAISTNAQPAFFKGSYNVVMRVAADGLTTYPIAFIPDTVSQQHEYLPPHKVVEVGVQHARWFQYHAVRAVLDWWYGIGIVQRLLVGVGFGQDDETDEVRLFIRYVSAFDGQGKELPLVVEEGKFEDPEWQFAEDIAGAMKDLRFPQWIRTDEPEMPYPVVLGQILG